MKNRKRSFPLGVLAAALMLFTFIPISSPSAQEKGPDVKDPQRGTRKLLHTQQLQPKAESRLTLGSMSISYYDDGSIDINAEGDYSGYGDPYAYEYEVDTSDATYSAYPTDPEQMPDSSDPGTGPGGGEDVQPPMMEDVRRQWITSRWWGRVRVQTLDPVFVQLTETSNFLQWVVFHDGSVDWEIQRYGCWAANPSSLGTHWFTRYCSSPWPYWNYTSVYSSSSGGYINWDFGNDSVATYVDQWCQIQALNNGWYRYWWRHTDAGEFSVFIRGRVRLN